MHRALALALLSFGIVLFSGCKTTGSHSEASTGRYTYSKTVNRFKRGSPIYSYCDSYWTAVCDEQSKEEFQFHQRQRLPGFRLSERIGLLAGTIEIDYSISKAGVMTIEGIRAPENMRKEQITRARTAMQKAASSLKPFPPNLVLLEGDTIRDTMVFDYR